MKTRFDAGKNLSEKRKELSKLCWLLLWTPLRDKEKVRASMPFLKQ